MDSKLFIHGIVNGEDFWCDTPAEGEIEQSYMSSFYRDDITRVYGPRLMVYGRNNGAGDYWYYTYVVGGNVHGISRPGSYFAMTLRLEACCISIGKMFRVLDMVFNLLVVGRILHKTGDTYQYAISSFKGAEHNLITCYNTIRKTIGECFTAEDFDMSIKKTGNSSVGEIEENLYDCNEAALVQKLRAGYRIIVSPTAISAAQRSIQTECQKRIEDMRRDCDVKLKDVAQKESSLLAVKADKERLEQANRQLQSQLKAVANMKKIEGLVGSIRQPVKELADSLATLDNGATHDKRNKVVPPVDTDSRKSRNDSDNRLWLQIATLALLIFIAFWLIFSGTGQKKSQEISEADTIQTVIPEEETPISYDEVDERSIPEIDPKTLRCNIEGYGGEGPLSPAKTYTLQLRQNGMHPTTALPVEWVVTGADTHVSPDNPNDCKIVPVAGMGEVTIAVKVDGKEYSLREPIEIQ